MDLLRYVGNGRQADSSYAAALKRENVRVIDTVSEKTNVTVRFDLNGRVAEVPLRPDVRDLMDLAVTVYIGDELETRESAPDRWTRDFRIVFPSSTRAKWLAATAELSRTLAFLSGDRFSFEWLAGRRLGSYGKHRTSVQKRYDVVCLFSGGVDSFLGAYNLLRRGKRVLLVGHQAEGITSSAQTRLSGWLSQKFKKRVDLLQCRVARAKREDPKFALGEKCEESHRPRSFLFLALGVAAARAVDVDEIWIPENGLIALNPPLGTSRIGAVSTRTAHPAFLGVLVEVIRRVGVFGGTIRNPFLYVSKTDMVAAADREVLPQLPQSVSCSHAGRLRWEGATGVRHCGYCVPCIYRRVAFMAAGLDDSRAYLHDVFVELPNLTEAKSADLRALTRFAKRVADATEAERQSLVVAQGAFPDDIGSRIGPGSSDGYAQWSQMLKRWSEDFLARLTRVASPKTKKILGV